MIEEIKKVENGFSITTDKGEFFLDFSKMNENIKINHISYSRLSYVQAYVIFSVKQRMKKKYMSQYLNTSRNVQHVTIYRS